MQKYLAALLTSALALPPLPVLAQLTAPAGMTSDAANVILPDAMNNLGLGTTDTPQFQAEKLAGSDATATPLANATASYLRLTNTNLGAGKGGQIQFGSVAGSPYATFGTALTDGGNNGTGDFVWGLRAGNNGAVTERLRLTTGSGGNLKAAGKLGFTGGGFFGTASTLGATWLDSYHAPGIETVTSVLSISPIGQSAGYFAARSSDNPNASPSVIPFTIFVANDKTSGSPHTWGEYIEAYLTNDGVGSQHFNTESVVINQWTPSAVADPFNRNPSRSTFNTRLGCGIGSATSNRCTAGLDIINETADYSSGIIIGSDALDTAAGRIAPALALATNHSVDWYRASGQQAWRLYSTATAGNQTIILGNSGATFSSDVAAQTLTANGATSGALVIKAPAVAGTNTLTLPAGTTDFSATGAGVVQQASAGAALTVATAPLSMGGTGQSAASAQALAYALKLPYVLAQSGAAVTNTAIGTSEVSMVAVAFPALAANDSLRVSTIWDTTGSNATNSKQLVVRLATTGCATPLVACATGTLAYNIVMNTSSLISASHTAIIRNASATNAQVFQAPANAAGVGGTSAASGSAAIETNAGGFLNINSQTTTASTDTVKLLGYTVELIPGVP